MTWTPTLVAAFTPTLFGDANVTMNVFGSLQLNPNMNYDFAGRIVFSGAATDNTVDFTTFTAAQDVIFDGTGAWELQTFLRVDSLVAFNEGTLNTNGRSVECQYFHSLGTANRTLNLTGPTGGSALAISGPSFDPINSGNADDLVVPLRITATNLTLSAEGSQIILIDPTAQVWLEEPGTLAFNELVLAAFTGFSQVLHRTSTGGTENYPTVSYNSILALHGTYFGGSPTINNLDLFPGFTYSFEAGQTFTFDAIQAFGSCLQPLAIEAFPVGSPAFFTTDDNIFLDGISLRDIHAQGTGTFTANEVVDLGNNDGWNLLPRDSDDFYWVGGTGNWDDVAHWSLSSGGPSAGCLPTAIDDVYFDVNSFDGPGQITTINVTNAYCRSMFWTDVTNMPILDGPLENSLNIGGSLTFSPDMQHTFAGDYYFNSSLTGNTVTSAGLPFNNSVLFTGVDGEWTLQDDLYVQNSLTFDGGTLRAGGNRMEANRFISETNTVRTLDLTDAYLFITNRFNFPGLIRITTDNLTALTDNSTVESAGAFSNLVRLQGSTPITFNVMRMTAAEVNFNILINGTGSPLQVDSIFFENPARINGNNAYNYVYLAPGIRTQWLSGTTHTIGTLDPDGDCELGPTIIRTDVAGQAGTFVIDQDQTFDRLLVQDIQQNGSGQLTANNSFDGGGNVNWTFNTGGERTLYWVGDSGDWKDQANWSLSSGGPGGECIPTPIDDVIFDANSFDGNPTEEVTNGVFFEEALCHNLTVSYAAGTTITLRLYTISVYGSIDIQAEVDWPTFECYLRGDDNHTLRSNGTVFDAVYFNGLGTYDLQDAFAADRIWYYSGTLNTNSENMTLGRLVAVNQQPSTLNLGDSYITISDAAPNTFAAPLAVRNPNLNVNAGNSIFELTNAQTGVIIDYPIALNRLMCSNNNGTARLMCMGTQFQRIDFAGNGEIAGNLVTDSLFCAPGKAYILESNQTQIVNEYWHILGNNCTPISLSASSLGTSATVSMPTEAIVRADFIQMRDQNATGGAAFNAGAGSTDIANSNQGWVFETAPEFIDVGFLGEDVTLCGGSTTLDAYNFSDGETYSWQDGSVNPTLTVDQSGEYSVTVTFATNCEISDAINITTASDFVVDLADDPSICDTDELILDPMVGSSNATYLWQDGSTDPTFTVTTSGEYFVIVDVDGCTASDTTQVTINASPALDLGPNQSACAGETVTLMSNVSADTFEWQDGSANDNLSVTNTGLYWLEATANGCSARDTVEVTFLDVAAVDLGSDTLLCDQASFTLMSNITGADYEWQDGSTTDSFVATTSGAYALTVTNGICSASDTINLTFQNNPNLNLPTTVTACTGETVTLNAPAGADNYAWSDGDTDADFSTMTAGIYDLAVTFGQCIRNDTTEVIFNSTPTINDLGADTTLCPNETLTLTAMTDAGDLTWSDSSTGNTLTVTTAGQYSFTANNNGCTAADTINVSFATTGALDLEAEYTACAGTTFSVTTMVAADAYDWSNGDTGPTFTSTENGTYTLIADFGNCSSTATFELAFITPPDLDLGSDQTLCAGTSVTLAAGTPGTWQDGTFASNYEATASGLYTVEVGSGDCTSQDSVLLTFLAATDFSLGEDQTVCESDSLILSIPDALQVLSWDDGSVDSKRTISETGVYFVALNDANNCPINDTIAINFAALPTLDLGPDTTICDNQFYTITAQAPLGTITWPDGSTGSNFQVAQGGTVTASVDNEGCINQTSVTITQEECTLFQAFVPNIFSPNDDGTNDTFFPQFPPSVNVISYELQIFDRWGSQLFSSTSLDTGWDGRTRGQLLPAGVYVYFINVTYEDDLGINTEVIKGDVSLLR
ncbi:MAG: gliding motility-associated C-terminal domain-containing protein [Bacteroidota bacterium]